MVEEHIISRMRDAVFVEDQDGNVVLANNKLKVMLGGKKKDFVKGPFVEIIKPTDRERVTEIHTELLAGDNVPRRYETILLTKGLEIPVEILVWPVKYRGRPSVAGIVVDITEKQRHQEELVRTQEAERKRLARALHDDTIQGLLMVSHRLQDANSGVYGRIPKRAREHLTETGLLVEGLISDTRRFIQALRPAILDDLGLVPALRWLTSRLASGNGIQAEVQVLGEERRLLPETELALFRIAQEALNNVKKHAQASSAILIMEFGEQKVTMSISDNGKGFKLPPSTNNYANDDKFGLISMGERAWLAGGTFNVVTAPSKGTTIKIEMAT